MNRDSRIYIAGHSGLLGHALVRRLQADGYSNLLLQRHDELDLTDYQAVLKYFQNYHPEYIICAAGKVGGIIANDTKPGDFIRINLQIQLHLMEAARIVGHQKLLFYASACSYPRMCPQPMKEESLFTRPGRVALATIRSFIYRNRTAPWRSFRKGARAVSAIAPTPPMPPSG